MAAGMVDRIAAKHGRKLHECAIGFKHIADLMMQRDILIGGEESGGIGYSRYLPERDGILNSLLLANVMAEEGKPLFEIVRGVTDSELLGGAGAVAARSPSGGHLASQRSDPH